jgi:hypothetical protein
LETGRSRCSPQGRCSSKSPGLLTVTVEGQMWWHGRVMTGCVAVGEGRQLRCGTVLDPGGWWSTPWVRRAHSLTHCT